MNMLMQTNIDDIRAEIMRLESAPTFDPMAWSKVIAQLGERPAVLQDAKRRMETAMHNQPMHVRTDLGMGGEDEIELVLVPVLPWDGVIIEKPNVSTETEKIYASS